MIFLRGRRDLEQAQQWFRMAAKAGDPDAAAGLGGILEELGDLDTAEVWYREAFEKGKVDAANSLGILLQKRGDLDKAETWFRAAADAGYSSPENFRNRIRNRLAGSKRRAIRRLKAR